MTTKHLFYITGLLIVNISCKQAPKSAGIALMANKTAHLHSNIPRKNELVVKLVRQYGPAISPTYNTNVCTELVIQILEKITRLDAVDKKRIRIITDKDVYTLLKQNNPIPKGVYYALMGKGVGIAIDSLVDVREGDFVQFWTDQWGHCGIVKSINPERMEMELYSSFPSTNGYGIQKFNIPKDCFFVRLK